MKLHLELVSGSNLITFKGFDCQVSPQKLEILKFESLLFIHFANR